jgi:hypothetical protein
VFLQEETLVILVIDDGAKIDENSAVFEIPTEEFDFKKEDLGEILYLAMAKGRLILADKDTVIYTDII